MLYDNDLLLRQETKKKIAYPGSWYDKNLKKHWSDVFSSKDAIFTGRVPNFACLS